MERSHWCQLNLSGSKVWSSGREASKQETRNVPLASADVRVEGRLLDEPKECLRSRLCQTQQLKEFKASRPFQIYQSALGITVGCREKLIDW